MLSPDSATIARLSNLSSKTVTMDSGCGTGGAVRATILHDRLLILQILVGQPLHRGGEVRIYDLWQCGHSWRPIKVLKDLQYSGPHNQQLLTMVNGES